MSPYGRKVVKADIHMDDPREGFHLISVVQITYETF